MSAPGDAAELSGVHLLFHEDWYDGPLSGLAEYEGRVCWYEAVWDEAADNWTWPRRLVLRELDEADIAEEWRVHRAFETYVGTLHCAHEGAEERVQRPESEWPKFFDAFPPGEDDKYADRPVIGTFTL